jgi:VWFA-related protein
MQSFVRPSGLFAILFFPLFMLGAFATSADNANDEWIVAPPPLRGWTDDLDLLATDREKDLFSSLRDDSERELFFEGFWQARDPFPQTSRNELREEWEKRLVEAIRRWRGLGDDRSRVFLLSGEPASISEVRCPTSGNFEIWTYEPGFRKKYRVILLFLTGGGPARLWRPGSPLDPAEAAAEPCSTPRLRQDAEWIRLQGRDQYAALLDWTLARPRPREWISTFRSVPRVAPPAAPELAHLLAEAEAALSAQRPRLRLRPPPDPLLIGRVRFSVQVEQAPEVPPDERIERVAFTLDDKPLLIRNQPPFDLILDLGPVPRPQKLRAEGIGSQGDVVVRDELLVNGGLQDFRVRLLEPRPGRRYLRSLPVLADVTPPPSAAVERVELWFGEDRIATLAQPPYAQSFVLPREGEAGYLRAVAYLTGGASAEDVVFINTPEEPDRLDVHMVELFTTVLDIHGRPVTGGLDPETFVVLENGVRQQIRDIEPAGDAPVRVVTLIDCSSSMAAQIGQARQAALDFLRNLLRPQDQAAVIAFNRSPHIMVPLTGDLGQLEEGLQGILAEGDTALYDSLVVALLSLAQAKGQRAVLLLSDGADSTSRLGFEQTLEVARQQGIAVYTIGLGQPAGESRSKLIQLAEVTGGQSFFAGDVAELAGVYERIEKELRAQVKIAYQSSHNESDGAFRKVQVRMAKSGMEARTISGYYP